MLFPNLVFAKNKNSPEAPISQRFQYITAFSQKRHFPKVLCHGAKSFVLQGAKYSDLCFSCFTSFFYPLYSSISLPLPPATPNPLPVPDLGIFVDTPWESSWFPPLFPLLFQSLFLHLFQTVVPSFWNHFTWAGSPDNTAF